MRKFFLGFIVFLFHIIAIQAQDNAQNADKLNHQAEAAFNKVRLNTNRDSLTVYRAVVNGVNWSIKCDEYDRMPNRKGKVKVRFEEENFLRLHTLYPMLIDAGLFLTKSSYTRQEGFDALELYLTIRNHKLVSEISDESGIAAYYLAFNYLKIRNFENADRYADLAMQYEETSQQAAEVKAECMREQMTTADDSLKYIAVVSKLYETQPANEKYFSWIMKFYQNPSHKFNLENFVDYQLVNNTNSIVPWILKGEIASQAGRWDEAIEAYKVAEAIDASSIPVAYNIGVCMNMKGILVRNDVFARKQKSEMASDNEFMAIFADARNYLERVKAKDPRRNKVDWVTPLYMDYIVLGDTIKAKELELLINKFKN